MKRLAIAVLMVGLVIALAGTAKAGILCGDTNYYDYDYYYDHRNDVDVDNSLNAWFCNRNNQKQNQHQSQDQSQSQGQGQLQGQQQTGIVNDGDQTVINEKPDTLPPQINNQIPEPYNGTVKDASATFGKLRGVTFYNGTQTVISVLDVDKYYTIGRINRWEVRKKILKKIGEFKGKKVAIAITAQSASKGYGMSPGYGGSHNPQSDMAVTATNVMGYSLYFADEFYVIEYLEVE